MAEITDITFKHIIKTIFNKHVNIHHILEFINAELTDSQKSILLELVVNTDTEYIPFSKNCYVFYKPNKYDKTIYGDEDRLIDLKLYKDDYMLAKITDSDNYSDDFNPFHQKFKVLVLGHDKDGKCAAIKGTVDHTELVVIMNKVIIDGAKGKFKSLNTIS